MQYVRNSKSQLTPAQCVRFGSVVLYEGREHISLNMWNVSQNNRTCHFAILSNGLVVTVPWDTEVQIIEEAR